MIGCRCMYERGGRYVWVCVGGDGGKMWKQMVGLPMMIGCVFVGGEQVCKLQVSKIQRLNYQHLHLLF